MSVAPEIGMLVESIDRYLADRYPRAARQAHSREHWRALAELGVLAALFEERQGGLAGSGHDIAAVFGALGRGLVTEPFLGALVAGRLLAASGEQELLDRLIAGETIDEVLEALCIGQDWDGDVRVVLFVRLKDGASLDDALISRIKNHIRIGASPRHVPAKIIAVADIPRTKSGKIVELAVRDVVHGRSVKNKEALANPEALALFEGIAALQS